MTFRPFLETFPSTKPSIKSPAVTEEAVDRNNNLEVTNMRSGEVSLWLGLSVMWIMGVNQFLLRAFPKPLDHRLPPW